ncbi:family 16 glycosylhydrolase [Skermanella mucosa]|uniref:family 16 glycosylhydrolase n=1 Tax=Skermanella mucosa TaxID=1789672 RepID=UPI001E65B692|nr:family 16 glycosylhydrolase [Skermanella mucosa]UEM18700.1 family 16 glycosylhydrolase [Skermanella mucosa]
MLSNTFDGYHLAFADEFTDVTASFPNLSWTTDFSRWGGLRTLSGNKELQNYVDPGFKGNSDRPLGLNPFLVKDGVLTIEAKPTPPEMKSHFENLPYTSGLLTSAHTQTYGYFEVRSQLPTGKGLWPAFWMVGDGNYGNREIDIFEVLGDAPGRVYQTVHRPDLPSASNSYYGINASDGFHTFGLEWSPDEIIWYVDGQTTFRQPNFVDVPMYMLLNLAVGGSWPGSPDATTSFPAQMHIDYVRAYEDTVTQPILRAGTSSDDRLSGSTRTDKLSGKAGNDILIGGMGKDTLDGGAGIDTAYYAGSTGAVSVNLQDKFAKGGHADGDTLVNIENLTGSAFRDTLMGNGLDNRIDGGPGSDTLTGNGGSDIFVIRNGEAGDTITDFGANDRLRLEAFGITTFRDLQAQLGQSGSDTVLNLSKETITFRKVQASLLKAEQFIMVADATPSASPAAASSHAVIAVSARGTAAEGLNAHFNVLVDGKKIGAATAGTATKNFIFKTDVAADQLHKVQVQFDNDAVINGVDRNLHVGKISINGTSFALSSSDVVYDRGALDGRDVLPGRSAMWWNGTLVISAEKHLFPASVKTTAFDVTEQQGAYLPATSSAVEASAADMYLEPLLDIVGMKHIPESYNFLF